MREAVVAVCGCLHGGFMVGGFAWLFQHLCLYDDDLVLAQNEDQNYAVLILWNDSLILQQNAMTKICT